MNEQESELFEKARAMSARLGELSFLAATSMSRIPTGHMAGGVVLNLLNRESCLKDFSNAVHNYQQSIPSYEI